MNESTGAIEELDWWLLTRSISNSLAASVAFEAIMASEEQLRDLGRRDQRFAYRVIVEGTWWVAALDEQIRKGLGSRSLHLQQAYVRARDLEVDGRYIRAFLWARNRHSHQLPFTTAYDETVDKPVARAPTKYSDHLVWAPAQSFPAADEKHANPKQAEAYDTLLAGHPLNATIYHCLLWFSKVAGRDPQWEASQAAAARSGEQ
ncbi:hypothetical protein IFU30_10910 [Plantibacter sp. CFBP 8798]|uniref:hypothetical protein n=1 Tax=Plantibacter sp. CFBP 8798 TaxID=2775268 RepID=UPI0017816598|nr:hypothetical protein [Plantibacter sp. CFBP 8798]MBD8466777.1 hypothetical protein [Plantibacter sp. CFBP 8798]